MDVSNMLCVILVGGEGARLKSILKDRLPKPLIPVEGKPFLHYQLKLLRRKGFKSFLLCTGKMALEIKRQMKNGSHLGAIIAYSGEERPLGTAGAVKHAQSYLKKPFFLLNGDTYLDINYRAFLRYHLKKSSKLSIAVTRQRQKASYGSIKMNADNEIIVFSEKKSISEDFVNAGAYVVDPQVLDFIPKNRAVSLEKETIPSCIKKKLRIYGYIFKGDFYDIGTPQRYRIFKNFIKKGEDRDI